MKISFLRNLIRKIIKEQFTPFSSFHKFETSDSNCISDLGGILYDDTLPGFSPSGPGGTPEQPWATYANSTLFWDLVQQPNPGQWIMINVNGVEQCIQYKGTFPPLPSTGPHTFRSNVSYIGNYNDCTSCQQSMAATGNPVGCTQPDFDYNASCGTQHLVPAPANSPSWQSFLNARWNDYNTNGCNHFQNIINWITTQLANPNPNWGPHAAARKQAKVDWAQCMQQECNC